MTLYGIYTPHLHRLYTGSYSLGCHPIEEREGGEGKERGGTQSVLTRTDLWRGQEVRAHNPTTSGWAFTIPSSEQVGVSHQWTSISISSKAAIIKVSVPWEVQVKPESGLHPLWLSQQLALNVGSLTCVFFQPARRLTWETRWGFADARKRRWFSILCRAGSLWCRLNPDIWSNFKSDI